MAPPKKPARVAAESLGSLLPALRALCRLLQHSDSRGMIIGGVAASLLGRPRLTADIDATVLLEDAAIPAFLERAERQGLRPRIGRPADFARRTAMLLLEHEGTGIPVDVAQGKLRFERESIERVVGKKVEGLVVPLPTPEDFIVMKAVASRPKDLEDIRGVVLAQPRLNVARIRKLVREFSVALDMPDLLTTVEQLVPKKTARGTRRSTKT